MARRPRFIDREGAPGVVMYAQWVTSAVPPTNPFTWNLLDPFMFTSPFTYAGPSLHLGRARVARDNNGAGRVGAGRVARDNKEDGDLPGRDVMGGTGQIHVIDRVSGARHVGDRPGRARVPHELLDLHDVQPGPSQVRRDGVS